MRCMNALNRAKAIAGRTREAVLAPGAAERSSDGRESAELRLLAEMRLAFRSTQYGTGPSTTTPGVAVVGAGRRRRRARARRLHLFPHAPRPHLPADDDRRQRGQHP